MTIQALPRSTPRSLRGLLAGLGRRGLAAIGVAFLLLVAAAVTVFIIRSRVPAAPATQAVVLQTLSQSVTASGTVNPQNTVLVGTQVSGTISAIYVDYNSHVTTGEVLARLDPSTLQAQVNQTSAEVTQAQGQAQASSGAAAASQVAIAGAQADVVKAHSALTLAQQNQTRDQALLAQGFIAASQVEADKSAVDGAAGDYAVAQDAVAQAQDQSSSSAGTAQASQAGISAAQAALQVDQLNLDRSVITSPVNGTVVSRAISVGETVAASLQTPTLFTIAADLQKMEVDISVGEPDIGNVKAGDAVSFTVLAYPLQTFDGTVEQVRINPQTVSNVVTYDVVVDVSNDNKQLLPGMTANATIVVASAKNALVVPIAALQYSPPSKSAKGAVAATTVTPWGAVPGGAAGSSVAAGSTAQVYVLRGSTTVAVPVRTDLVTATQAAVTPLSGSLLAGDLVIVGSAAAPKKGSAPAGASPARGLHP
jgi:HlyD family secretion protein